MSLDYSKFAGGTGFSAEALKPFADSPGGVAFLEKHLHPPGPPINTVEGLPDCDSQPSVVMEFRNAHTIPAPAAATNTWDCLLVVQPLAKIPAVYWSYPTGTINPFTSANQGLISNDNLHTATLDEAQHFSRLRTFAKSCTVYFNAPSLADQGTVYMAQTRSTVDQIQGDAASQPYSAINFGQLTTDGETLLMLSPKAIMTEAKKGAYQSYGFTQPVVPYRPSVGNDGTVPVPWYRKNTWINGTAGQVQNITPTAGTTPVSEMTTGFILFTGMALTTTLEVKIYEDLELVASPDSPFTPFQTPGAMPDTKALESSYKIRYHMADGYPSALNFLGALGSLLARAAPTIGRVVGSFLPSLSAPRPAAPVKAIEAAPVQRAPIQRPVVEEEDDEVFYDAVEAPPPRRMMTRSPPTVQRRQPMYTRAPRRRRMYARNSYPNQGYALRGRRPRGIIIGGLTRSQRRNRRRRYGRG